MMRAALFPRRGLPAPAQRITVGRRAVDLARLAPIGQGGEADVYDLGDGRALKVFKGPGHADFARDPARSAAAAARIDEHQRKLRDFPAALPARVVAPESLALDPSGRIVGYAMPLIRGGEVLLRYSRREFRARGGISTTDVLHIFRDLHGTVRGLHAAGVVIGDFNDLNVLASGRAARLIDADSYQFGPYLAASFTERFVDPLLCDGALPRPVLARPYTADADWYAFAVLLFQSLLFVDPYGGVHAPASPAQRVPHAARPLKRVTVFDPAVRLPKVAERWDVLPDDLLEHFHATFERDRRGAFPLPLLESLRWTTCAACGAEHARPTCPRCPTIHPARVREVVRIRGTVTATRVFQGGIVLHAAMQDGRLRWIAHDGTRFVREDGRVVLEGALAGRTRWRIQGETTLLARGRDGVALAPGKAPERFEVDAFGPVPVLDATARRRFHLRTDGRIEASGRLGPEVVGSVIPGATLFWAGERFGFGFWRAREMTTGFVFDTEGASGLYDRVPLPPLRGEVVDAACWFADERCWFFAEFHEGGRALVRLDVVTRRGEVEASLETTVADTPWLAGFRGAAAAGAALLVPTDAGVVRVAVENGAVEARGAFPDTEPFVSAGDRLFAGPDALWCVGRREVTKLVIRP